MVHRAKQKKSLDDTERKKQNQKKMYITFKLELVYLIITLLNKVQM